MGVVHGLMEGADAGTAWFLAAAGAPPTTCSTRPPGAPAFTGVDQATALAPTALEAELRAKAAVLSG